LVKNAPFLAPVGQDRAVLAQALVKNASFLAPVGQDRAVLAQALVTI